MDKEGKRHWSVITNVCCIAMLLFAVSLCSITIWEHYKAYHYSFPLITDSFAFFEWTLLNTLAPFVLLVVSILFFLNRKKGVAMICCILFFPTQFFFIYRGAAEILFHPTVISHTTLTGDFGKYDRWIHDQLNSIDYFPKEIPASAANIQYSYYYCESSTHHARIVLVYDNADISAIKQQITESSEFVTSAYNSESELVYRFADDNLALGTMIILDEENERVGYIVTSDKSSFPRTFQDILSYLLNRNVRECGSSYPNAWQG